jgi:hypothetical protein
MAAAKKRSLLRPLLIAGILTNLKQSILETFDIYDIIKNSSSELVSARRSTVQSLPLQKGFPDLSVIL